MKKPTSISEIFSIVFRGLALAMGVSVAVLNILQIAAPSVTGTLLGFGLAVLALDALDKEKGE